MTLMERGHYQHPRELGPAEGALYVLPLNLL